MNKKFTGKAGQVRLKTRTIREPEGTPNTFTIGVPDAGTINIVGTSEFVSTVLRQLLEHPESLVGAELLAAYNALSATEQKRLRRFFKIGEFAKPDDVAWPAWL